MNSYYARDQADDIEMSDVSLGAAQTIVMPETTSIVERCFRF